MVGMHEPNKVGASIYVYIVGMLNCIGEVEINVQGLSGLVPT